MRIKIPNLLAAIFMIAGFSLLFYPDLSNMQKSMIHSAILREYDRFVYQLPPEEIARQLYRAGEVNARLSALPPGHPLLLGELAQNPQDYYQTLYAQGVMAWLDIPSIDVSLPVYHGTGSEVLMKGVGHLEGTAFPTGGEGTHAALTTHSGMPGTRLFTDLHQMRIDDKFFISVLGQRLAYQVDQITVILPHEIEYLRVTPGQDFVTLITCTPVALNTHRLLVRGTRIPYVEYMADAIPPEPLPTGLKLRGAVFGAFLLVYFIIWRSGRRPRPVSLLEDDVTAKF